MNVWKRYKEFRESEKRAELTVEELLLQASTINNGVTKSQALSIPSVSACVDIITGIIGSLDIKLYREYEGKTKEIKDDRTFLLNKSTGDTLNCNDFKKALVHDYLLEGNGYCFINKTGSEYKSLNYIETKDISIFKGVDPIFKDFDISVNGTKYLPFQFIKLLRNTKDGCKGQGIILQNNDALTVAYLTMVFEKTLVKTGGNKKGFLKAKSKLVKEALDALKAAWDNLYKNNTENVVILNDGLEFQEAQQSSVELQLNENKKTNNAEICKLFGVPSGLLEGNITREEYNSFIKTSILPILSAFEHALKADLLTETEKKEGYYFQFDTKDILKASQKERFESYEIACRSGWITKNEIRNIENYEELQGMDVVSMSLGDILFDVDSKSWFVPNTSVNTDLSKSMKEVKQDNGT